MSKYDTTKFYWLQLKEDFFEDDAINWLEEQEPNGRDYAYFYLKLCLKSLKSNGILIRKVGNILIPYDNKKLAELTKMDYDTVVIAMELLKKIGLVQILENGEIYINQLEKLIGSQSVGAFKKQQQRLIGRQTADNCPPDIDIELKLEKEIDIEAEVEKDNIIDYFNNNIHCIVQKEYEDITNWEKTFSDEMIKLAIDEAVLHNVRTMQYINSILRSWKEKGYKLPSDIQPKNNKQKMSQDEIERWMNEDE